MSTRKTILVHGGLTAGVLAVVGYLFAQIAGMWVASQSAPRSVDGDLASTATSTAELAAVLEWRLPVMMALFGFSLVALGEGVKSIWKQKPVPTPAPTPEAELQRMLKELEAKPAEGQPV